MNTINEYLVNSRTQNKKNRLEKYFNDLEEEISTLTNLTNTSISYEKDSLSVSYKWLNDYISSLDEKIIRIEEEDYYSNFNAIFNYIKSIYEDNEIYDEINKDLITSFSKSLSLLNAINKIIASLYDFDNYLSNQIKSFLNYIDQRLESINNNERQLDIFKDEMNLVLDNSRAAFNDSLTGLYIELQKSTNKKIDEQISQRQIEIDKEIIGFSDLKDQLNEQVNLYASATLSDQNKTQAEEETKTANLLRIFGGIWLIIVSGISFYFFNDILNSEKNNEISMLVFRWMSILLMTIPGVYILRESSIHRSDARKYRRLATQLATINSYLATFEKNDAREVKRSLISNFFSSDETKTDFSSVPDLLKSFEKVQDTILSIASKKSTQPIDQYKEETTKNKEGLSPS